MIRMGFIESDAASFGTSEILFYYHCLAVYRVQLTDWELDGTIINQHNCLLTLSLAHLSTHPSTSSVNYELNALSCEDNSLWHKSERHELRPLP